VAAGVRVAFLLALVMALLAAVLQQIMIEEQGRNAPAPEPNPLRLWREMPASLRNLARAGVAYLDLAGPPILETGLVWRRDDDSPTLRNLLSLLDAPA
jgi:hypothetical protein